jgi:hypothetical protein
MLGSKLVKPVMLPPGCARLATKPAATGSLTSVNTIGMLLVLWRNSRVVGGALGQDHVRWEPHQFGDGGPCSAVVIIKGLVPGMELSTGNWVAVDTWQLQARDLPYAWIAPPEGFMGSADLVAELRLPDS